MTPSNWPPVDPPLKTGLQRPGFYDSVSKNPVLRPVLLTPSNAWDGGLNTTEPGRGYWPRWKAAIASRNLSDPADVEELYGLAVAAGRFVASEQNRLLVFTQAALDQRSSRSPGAIFRENVTWARWWGSSYDQDIAREMIAQLDGDDELRTEVEPVDDRGAAIAKAEAWAAARGVRLPAN